MHMPTGFIWIIILIDETLKYSDGVKYWGYIETYFKELCVELYNLYNDILL